MNIRVMTFCLALASLPAAAQLVSGYERGNPNVSEYKMPDAMDPSLVVLPAYPKMENLLEFDAGPAARNRVFVDPASISLGGDQVVRYTLVVKAAGGATNVSYEGDRCEAGERISYAFGLTEGNWYRPKEPKWKRFGTDPGQPQYRQLASEVFCPVGVPARTVAEMIAALKATAPRR